jgi:hypothetical protein
MVPRFSMVEEIPDDIDIRQLIAEFNDHAEGLPPLLMWNMSSRAPPLGVDSIPLCKRSCNKV